MIDLHIHSTASDGTDAPEIIAKKIAAESGIKIFALTDHDTINGVEKIQFAIPADIFFINGVEFSCKTALGYKCHILAYFYDSTNEEFQKILQQGKNLHQEKLFTRLNFLAELYGINFSESEVAELSQNEVVGKPHIVNFVVEKFGIAKEKIYADLENCKTKSSRLDARAVIDAIKSAGGVAVWAHPLGGEGETFLTHADFQTRLEELIDFGIAGLECYYSRYDNEQEKFLAETAQKNNLYISGGSDYHGKNKNISLGELGTEKPAVKIFQLTILKKIFEYHKNLRVRKAFEIAKKAHAGQVDKAGVNYIFHPMTVAFQCGGDDSAIIVALLHDVAEDTNLTIENLRDEINLTAEEVLALKILTHDKNIPYFEYIQKIKTNSLATKVKIADLKNNSDLSRISLPTEKDLSRVEKYQRALQILQ